MSVTLAEKPRHRGICQQEAMGQRGLLKSPPQPRLSSGGGDGSARVAAKAPSSAVGFPAAPS